MVDILKNIMNIAYRVRDMQIAGTLSMALFGVVLVFGIMNCVLGYRLLRFWMMIFGFLIGAGIGLFAIHQIGFGEKMYYAVGMIGVGLVLAILSFAVFKAGIFIMGAGIGLTITVYIIHPTTSFSFFICLLAGVGLGMLALRYEREVIIVGKYQKDDRNGKKLIRRKMKTRQSAEGKKSVMIKRILPGSSTESIRKSMKRI